MTRFARQAIQASFDSGWGENATYLPAGGGAVPVRIIRRQPDTVADLTGRRVVAQARHFHVRVSEVAAPARGDKIQVPREGGEVFEVMAEPERADSYQLVWTLEMSPGTAP